MNVVKLSTEKYDALQRRIQAKAAKIDALEQEIAKLKSEHEEEIRKMAEEGKVRYISAKRHPLIHFLILDEKEYKGFDDVKAEVYEHYKQGLFKEELEKHLNEKLRSLIKKVSEKETVIDEQNVIITQLRNRSLWQRIRNK